MTEYEIVGKAEGPTPEALEITFNCPKCNQKIITTWLFPDTPMTFTTDCCEETVIFEPK